MLRSYLMVFALLLFLSCNTTEVDYSNYDIQITMNNSDFVYKSDVLPHSYLVNKSKGDIYLPASIYVGFERKKDGQWGEFTSWFIIDGTTQSILLAPDDSIGTSIGLPYFYVDSIKVPGEYRFKFLAYSDEELKNPLPASMLTSNSFFIHN